MNDDDGTVLAAELESTKNALQAACKELETARNRENKLFDTLKEQASALSETKDRISGLRRYAEILVLLTIVALAALQVIQTYQLRLLLT